MQRLHQLCNGYTDSRQSACKSASRAAGSRPLQNTAAVTEAVILAAGCGRRLRGFTDIPKGLVRFAGRSLIECSIERLASRGIARIVVVTGYRRECYKLVARRYGSLIDLVDNPNFATTGTLESMRRGVSIVDGPCLLLESDIAYDARALDACLASPDRNATVVSGFTGAGDEVWVTADPERRLLSMSKRMCDLDRAPLGEFVGITRLTSDALHRMVDVGLDTAASYDTDALMCVSRTIPVHCCYLSSLNWGEIDDERQVRRLRALYPAITAYG